MNKASDYGITPLGAAATNGHDSCVELLLAAPGIHVNHVNDSGENALLGACSHVMDSLRQVGSGDSTRTFVRLLWPRGG